MDRVRHPCVPRNYAAVGLECVALGATKFDDVGGFPDDLERDATAVSLGRRLEAAGYRNAFWPSVSVRKCSGAGPWPAYVPARGRRLLRRRDPDFARDGHFNRNLGLSERHRLYLKR